MRKRKKNEFLKNDSIIPNEEDYDDLIKKEEEYDESARMKKLVMLFAIPLILILGFLYKSKFNPEHQQQILEKYQAEKKVKSDEKKLSESNQLIKIANEAIEKKDFEKAVFLYRRAISYQPKNIELHKMLIATLEESCKSIKENEMHCNAIEKARKKLGKLQKQ